MNRALAAASRSHGRTALFVTLACVLLFLPGFFTLQPMDRDEPRFAQASKQMLETGDYVRIRFQDDSRNNKPAATYWAQTLSVSAAESLGLDDARRQIWVYRLPSLLGAIAAVLLTYWAALAFVARAPAALAALLLASTLVLGVEARLAKTDAMLLASVVAAMGAFARIYLDQGREHSWRLAAIFWTAIGAGILIKGPITPLAPLLAGVTLAIVDRGAPWLGRLKLLPGLAWALALATPWFVLIMIETQGAFLADSLGRDMLGKVRTGQEGHGAPPLTYLVAFWITAWPLAAFAALAAPFAWRARRRPETLFLLAWIVPLWIMFELARTKLPHYVLPTYPAIAIMVALALREGALMAQGRWRKAALSALPVAAALVVAAGVAVSVYFGAWPAWPMFVFAPLALALAGWAAWSRWTMEARILGACASAAALYLAAYGGVLTAAPGQVAAVSPKLAAAAREAAPSGCATTDLVTAGYYEPSLVFLTRTDLVMSDGAGAAKLLLKDRCRLAFVESRQEPAFLAGLDGAAGPRVLTRVRGVNINGGRKLDIGVWGWR